MSSETTQASSCSCGEFSDSANSDTVLNTESDSEVDSESDADLDVLYKSFELESETELQPPTQKQPRHALTTLGGRNTPLYRDAELTALQSQLLIFQYAVRHSLTKKALTELLQLLSVHLPSKASIPTSVHMLKNHIIEAFPEATAEEHYYCNVCQRLLQSGTQQCQGGGCSGGSPASFITLPLGPQLKRLMEGMFVIGIHFMACYFDCLT